MIKYNLDKKDTIKELEKYFDLLWPICRSITGNGLRNSFEILQKIIPLNLHEIPSGAKAFDWEIPNEWNIKDAYIITPSGKKIANFKENNLHIVNYSTAIDKEISYSELIEHLYYKKDLPDAIPYVTSYYKQKWGFCISYNDFLKLEKEGSYKVFVDAELKKGSLTFGDLVLKGRSDKEIVFSSYLCHPSMANNELSGPLALAFLYNKIKNIPNRYYTVRFIIAPETIGAIGYLSKNHEHLIANTISGFVITCCGINTHFTYKKSRIENSITDKIAEYVLKSDSYDYKIIDFDPIGSDERQFCSPGINLPFGSLMRGKYSEYKEYHTSLDNKNLISFDALNETIECYYKMYAALELNRKYKNTVMFCEPKMDKYNLYSDNSGKQKMEDDIILRMRLLNQMDGETSLLDFCDKFGYDLIKLKSEIEVLINAGLLS